MGQVKPVFDTNILIDYLNGIAAAKHEIERFAESYISSITWIEVMTGSRNPAEAQAIRRFLDGFRRVAVDLDVAELTIAIRQQYRIKLPDAIIWATARRKATLLVTRNTKDFPETEADIRVPYRL